MNSELVIAIAGLGGAVGSTVAGGLRLVQAGSEPRGLVTEIAWPIGSGGPSLALRLNAAALANITVCGWDVDPTPIAEAVRRHAVFSSDQVRALDPLLGTFCPWPAPLGRTGPGSFEAEVERLVKIREERGAVVVVDLLPTTAAHPDYARAGSVDELRTLLDTHWSASVAYALLALDAGVPHVNFTPNLATDLAPIGRAFEERGIPFAGKDGKTGQTLWKTAMAPVFALRALAIDGWISANYLGNGDGVNLAAAENCALKVGTKSGVLESILGYQVPDHIVDIRYYRPRGDAKEAWDNVDFTGFGDVRMQLKLNLLGSDSALAAPIVLDCARLLSVGARHGQRGARSELGLFFKAPLSAIGEGASHDLFRQREFFEAWASALERQLK